ncbi:MAG: UDP-N-acetylmuramoylalanyl-D-glutamyl-2,6-diaminopimelate--D-alanyl-D-alanine ligase [Alphaproteobacteria bacterium]|nr:UDP-N-acetylmuramoylalanyl-D-glutamyl-2,6-diaminopimelate--D-alanyl-D-alanine ligase [Alphaproteobacteria bacterium]
MTGQPQTLWTSDDVALATEGRFASGAQSESWQATGVSIDSRNCASGDLFVALAGPNFDGHDYVGDALAGGAAGAVVSRIPDDLAGSAQLIAVDDCEVALTALGQFARDRSNAQFVCVTGSVGKTSTKDGLAVALGACGTTHATAGNLNNHLGAPLTLARMPVDAAYSVLELGMNHAGELTPLSQLARPDVAIITTIEAVHLEFFDSVCAIAEAKAEIFAGLGDKGVAILNRDNAYFAYLATIAAEQGAARILGFGADPDADARLIDTEVDDDGSDVTAEIDGHTLHYRLNAPGRHRVINSLAVLAAVAGLGANIEAAAAALGDVAVARGRGRRHRVATATGDYVVIDDSYNASPASMRAALDVLGAAHPGGNGRRIAVLGDMLELGPEAPRLHAGLIRNLEANNVDQVFSCGPLMAALDGVLSPNMRGDYADTSEQLLPTVLSAVQAGDVVLVKGSLGSRVGPIAEALINGAGGTQDKSEGGIRNAV